ncbi:MAG: MFS transporter [Hydrogenophilales bacterium 28-61-23]|nr:MAG: MFS transporter [Hydrogenophilales bacterium 28-61-23]
MLTSAQRHQLHRLRWTAFSVVGAAYVLSFFHRFAPAAIAADLQNAFQINATALGSLAATYFYVYTLMQIPTGILADTLGPRRIVAVGGVLAGAGSLLFGLADTFNLAALGRLLVGLGVSVTFIALLKLNAVWFSERHFGSITGLAILLGNFGSLLAASPLAWALGYVSWREVFVAVGLLSLFLAGLAWWLVRDNPVQSGLPSLRELDGKAAHPAHDGHWYDGLLQVAGNRATWPGFFVNLGVSGTLFAFAGLWAVPFLSQGHGWDRTTATGHTSLLLAGFALGAFFIGTLSDRLGRRKPVVIVFCGLYVACWLPLLLSWALRPGWSHALFFLMGLGAAGFTLTWACAKEVNRHALSGMATSLVNTGAFLGGAILQPLVGWAIEHAAGGTGLPISLKPSLAHYQVGIAVLFGFALFGWLASFALRETNCRYVSDPA